MRENKDMKKNITALFVAICLILSSLLLSGCQKQSVSAAEQLDEKIETAMSITRGQWLTMLGETFGLDTYTVEQSYYSDIQPGNPLFTYVQAASEWGILSTFPEASFNADKEITHEEVAYTAAIAAGYTGDDPIRFAADNGFIQSGAAQADVVSVSEGVSALEAAKEYYLHAPGEEVVSVKANGEIVNISDYDIEISEDTITTTDDIKVEEGAIILTAPTAEHPFGVAYKVTGVIKNGSQTVLKVIAPKLEDLYDEIIVHTTVPADLSRAIWADGVTVIGNGKATGVSFAGMANNSPVFLSARYEQPPIELLAEKTGTYSDVLQVEFPKDGDGGVKISSEKISPFLSNIAGAKIFEDSNFVYTDTPSLDDFSESDAPWSKTLDEENKYDEGYKIIGELNIKEITIIADVEYYKPLGIETKIRKSTNSVTVNADIESSLSLEGNLNKKVEVGVIPIPIGTTGLTVSVCLYLYTDVTGALKVSAELQYSEKVEKQGLLFKHVDGDADITPKVSAAIDLEFGAGLAVALDALGAVALIDAGIEVGADYSADASISGNCETSTEGEITTKTYSESLNIEVAAYVPIIKVYAASDETVVGTIVGLFTGEDVLEWDIIDKDKAKKEILYDDSWVFWSETVVVGADGKILSSEVTIGNIAVYQTRFAEVNHTGGAAFEFTYPLTWSLQEETVSSQGESVTLTNNRGASITFYQIPEGININGGGSGVLMYSADISKIADSEFTPGYVQAVDYTDLGTMIVAQVQTTYYDRLTGDETSGPVCYAVLPESKIGNMWDNRVYNAALSFDYSGHISFIAQPPTGGTFTEEEVTEVISILSSFKVAEEEIDDSIYDALMNGDYSMFAGTYIPLERFNDFYSWDEEKIPNLKLFSEGKVDGGQFHGRSMYSDKKPYTVTINSDGSYSCHVQERDTSGPNVTYEYFIIYPPGTAITNSYLKDSNDYSPDKTYIQYIYAMGGIMDIVYVKQ